MIGATNTNMNMTVEILQWIIFIIFVGNFNLGWIKGCRDYLKHRGGFMYQTAASTMMMTITTFIFLFSDINKFHLIWLTPFFIFISGTINSMIFSIPIVGNVYFWLTVLFAKTITIGVKTTKTPEDYISIMSRQL